MSADHDSVASRTSIKETCADTDRETVVSSLFGSVSKGKRDRDQNVVHTFRERQHLHKICERKAELAVRGEKLAQRRLHEAEADVEVKHWKREIRIIVLYELNQEFESQRLKPQEANQWADRAQRDKISLYGELEMRSGLFRETQAKDCQEIEESRRICCEETDRTRQARIDELSMHQERNPSAVGQFLTQTLEGSRSGYLAESLHHTGYEPNTCIDVSSEHTLINYSSRRNIFNIENVLTTTVAASENFDGFHQQAAASDSLQLLPACEVNPWLSADLWSRTRKQVRGNASNASVEGTLSRRKKRSKSGKCANCLKGKIYMFTWSRKLNWLFKENAQLGDDYLKVKRTWK